MSGKVSKLAGRALRIITLIAIVAVYAALIPGPVGAQGFSVTYGKLEFTVAPGDTFTGSIPVTNVSEEQITVRMYVGDWVPIPGQTSGYEFSDAGGTIERSMASWVEFSPERMTLEPGETKEVLYDVNTPDDTTLEGSYWAVIFLEKVTLEGPDILGSGEEGVAIGITSIWRYAIKIYLTMEDTKAPDATFTTFNMESVENGFKATATLQNDGNIYLKPEVWLEMRNPAGEVIYTQEHREQTVLPESARDFVFELRDLPIESGEYLVMVIADYGVQGLIAAQGRVNLTITPPVGEGAAGEEGEGESAGEDGSGATGEGSPSG